MTQFYDALDGTRLAWREMGSGHPVVLVHGLFSDAATNWIKYGAAQALVEAGYRVIMPDLRAHGESDKPHDALAYPNDILAIDLSSFIEFLGLSEFALAGYSLGARTCVRAVVNGVSPGRLILSGMGLAGLIDTSTRAEHFRNILLNVDRHERGSPEWMAAAFLKTTGGDRVALNLLLDSFVDTSEAELNAITVPTGVICGVDDQDNGSAADLAASLQNAAFIEIPGNHMSAVTKLDFGRSFVTFLAA